MILGCSASGDDSASGSCIPGTTASCMCPGNLPSAMTCLTSGTGFGACACNATPGSGGAVSAGTGGTIAGGTGNAGSGSGGTHGTGGTMVPSGTGGGTGGAPPLSGSGGMTAGSGGMTAGSGGMSAGSGGSGNAADEFDSLRQFCVDYVNMYRATLMLPALARETHDKEMCSDMGAKQDADANQPHGSAGMCFMGGGYYGAGQNTCPSLPVGGFGGAATLQDALKRCLDQMWGEGPPPSGTTVQQCIDDHAGCFQMHGHWINMTQTMYKSVSCGFYKKADGSYWGNQDYPIKF